MTSLFTKSVTRSPFIFLRTLVPILEGWGRGIEALHFGLNCFEFQNGKRPQLSAYKFCRNVLSHAEVCQFEPVSTRYTGVVGRPGLYWGCLNMLHLHCGVRQVCTGDCEHITPGRVGLCGDCEHVTSGRVGLYRGLWTRYIREGRFVPWTVNTLHQGGCVYMGTVNTLHLGG